MKLALMLLALALNAHADLTTSPLGQLAAALQPGQSAKLGPGDGSLAALPMPQDLLSWGDSAAYGDGRLDWIAKRVGVYPYQRLQYDIAADHWTIENAPWTGNGHGYDGNAFGYFARYTAAVHKRNSDGTWQNLPAPPWALGTVMSLTDWSGHGLVLVNRAGLVALWDGNAWQNIPGAAPWGNTGTWSELGNGVVYLGVGTAAYRLNADHTLTALPTPPWSMSNNQALHMRDPATGHLIVAKLDGTAWVEYDGSAWIDRPDLKGSHVKKSRRMYQTTIDELGIIVIVSHYYSEREVWALKP